MSTTVPQLANYHAQYLEAKRMYLSDVKKVQSGGRGSKQRGGSSRRPRIIHIVGEAGSGKTTLGARLAKLSGDVAVIELDDIQGEIAKTLLADRDSPDSVKILNPETNLDSFFEYINYHGARKLRERIDELSSTVHLVILIGFTIPVAELVDQAYILDVSPEQLYRQLTLRSARDIHDNYKQIRDLLEVEQNFNIIDITMTYVFNIRRSFPVSIDILRSNLEMRREGERRRDPRTRVLTADKIHTEISKMLEELSN
jgi:molybdopterin-guanine dinucleotide biosynthesis protein